VNDPFVTAAAAGDLPIVTHDLDAGVSPNAGSSGEEGVSALSAAASSGQVEVVRLLLDRGADVNADDYWGGNALCGPSLNGHVDVVQLLLSRGADPNMEDDGTTPLDYACGQIVFHEMKVPLRNYSHIIRLLKMNGGKAMMLHDPLVSFGFFLPW
jgi:ankyrin repeat protein